METKVKEWFATVGNIREASRVVMIKTNVVNVHGIFNDTHTTDFWTTCSLCFAVASEEFRCNLCNVPAFC